MDRRIEELLKNIQTMIKCPHCGSSYTKENISIVGQMGEAVLVQLSCHVCDMPVMATVVVSGKSQGFISRTENSSFYPKDKKELSSDSQITSDDILEMHSFLEEFNGDFEQLFGK